MSNPAPKPRNMSNLGFRIRDAWLDNPDNAANPNLKKGSPEMADLCASSGYSEDQIWSWLAMKRTSSNQDPRIKKAMEDGHGVRHFNFGMKLRCSRCGSVEHTVSTCTMSLEQREELEETGEAYVKEKNRSSERLPRANCPGGPGCAECADPNKICTKIRRKVFVPRGEKPAVDRDEAEDIFDALRERPLHIAYEGPHKAAFKGLNDEGVTIGDVARLGGAAFNSANVVVRVFKGTLDADDVCTNDEEIIAFCELSRQPPLVPKCFHFDDLGSAPGELSRKEAARRITGYAAIYVEDVDPEEVGGPEALEFYIHDAVSLRTASRPPCLRMRNLDLGLDFLTRGASHAGMRPFDVDGERGFVGIAVSLVDELRLLTPAEHEFIVATHDEKMKKKEARRAERAGRPIKPPKVTGTIPNPDAAAPREPRHFLEEAAARAKKRPAPESAEAPLKKQTKKSDGNVATMSAFLEPSAASSGLGSDASAGAPPAAAPSPPGALEAAAAAKPPPGADDGGAPAMDVAPEDLRFGCVVALLDQLSATQLDEVASIAAEQADARHAADDRVRGMPVDEVKKELRARGELCDGKEFVARQRLREALFREAFRARDD